MHYRVYLFVGLILAACLSGCDYFISPAARVERAGTLIEAGDRRAAVVELKNALQKQPDLHRARVMLADAALWLGDAESADAQLRRVPADFNDPDLEDLHIRVALALNRLDDVQARLAHPQLRLAPARREMYRGYAFFQGHDLEKAQKAFEGATAGDSSLLTAHVGLIETLHARGARHEALGAAKQLTEQHPGSADAWFVYAQTLARTNAKETLSALERARDLAPGRLEMRRHVMLLTALAEQQLMAGKPTHARITATQLSQLAPGSPIATLISSRVSMASNDNAAAAAELRRLVNASPQLTQARFMLGAALAAQGNLEQASQELEQVVEQAPQFIEARQLLAQVKMRLEDPDGALQVLVPGLGGEGVDARYLALVDAARSSSNAEGATIELLEKAVARDPANRGLVRQLSSAYLESGNAPQALKLLRAAARDPLEPQQEALHLHALFEVEGAPAAKAYADSLLERHRADFRAVSLVAALYARIGDFEGARRLIQTQLDAGRAAPELVLTLARIDWAAREPARALDVLRRLSRAHPEFAAGRIALAEAELSYGDRAAARAQLEVVRKNDPASAAPRMMLARLALADQDVASAEALIEEARKGADAAAIEGAAGLMYLNYGRYDQAIARLQAALAADAGVAPWWLHLGRAQMALNQHAAARESFERALSIRPRWTAAEGALAFLDLQQGASEAAIQRAAALRAAKPRDIEAIALDAQVHYALRRYPQAARAFDDAIAIRPSAALAISAYEARRAAKEPDAVRPLEDWLARRPQDSGVRFALAEAHLHLHQREQAATEYRAITIANPHNVAALNNLAWVYYELKDPRAEETARRASAAAPDSPEVSDTLGWILVEGGRINEGLAILQRAAAASPRSPEIAYHYAAALIRSGATEQGAARLREVLNSHSSFASRAEAERLLRGS